MTTVVDLDPYLVADCRPVGGGVNLLSVRRSKHPASETSVPLLTHALTRAARTGKLPERLEQREDDTGFSVLYRIQGADGFGLIVASGVFQFHSVRLNVLSDRERTDIVRAPNVDPSDWVYQWGVEHAQSYGQVHRETVALLGVPMIAEHYWCPDVEDWDAPENPERIELGQYLPDFGEVVG